MPTVDYPSVLRDLVVAEFSSPDRLGVSVKPIEPGLFRFLIWPVGLPDPDLFRHTLFHFRTAAGPPERSFMNLADFRSRSFRSWKWALIETSQNSTALADLGRVLYGEEHALTGQIDVHTPGQQSQSRCLAWSCHMPYETLRGRAAVA